MNHHRNSFCSIAYRWHQHENVPINTVAAVTVAVDVVVVVVCNDGARTMVVPMLPWYSFFVFLLSFWFRRIFDDFGILLLPFHFYLFYFNWVSLHYISCSIDLRFQRFIVDCSTLNRMHSVLLYLLLQCSIFIVSEQKSPWIL